MWQGTRGRIVADVEDQISSARVGRQINGRAWRAFEEGGPKEKQGAIPSHARQQSAAEGSAVSKQSRLTWQQRMRRCSSQWAQASSSNRSDGRSVGWSDFCGNKTERFHELSQTCTAINRAEAVGPRSKLQHATEIQRAETTQK